MPKNNNSSSFRLQTKYIFLTYPHCDVPKEHLLEFLWNKLTSFVILFIAVSTEHHEDGSPHLHCLVQLDKKPNIRFPDYFDIANHHPNIQPARNSKQVLDYISKDGNIITRGDFKEHRVSPSKKDDRWRDIVRTATSREHFLEMIKDQFPYDWATKLHWLEYSASKLFPIIEPPYVHPFPDSPLLCHENIESWVNEELYLVSIDAYQHLHTVSYNEAFQNLNWMDNFTRNMRTPTEEESHSTSVDQPGQERPPGPEASDDTTTSTEQ
jgi:hypothetical protein